VSVEKKNNTSFIFIWTMKVELLSVPISSPLNEECDTLVYNRCGREAMQGNDTKEIAEFIDFCFLEEILLYIGGMSACCGESLPCDWDGWMAVDKDDLDYIIDQMTSVLGTNCDDVDRLCEACRQAKQHLHDGRLVYVYFP
jgi:hypothetical protein